MKFIVALSFFAVVAADVSHLGATDYSSEYAPPSPQLEYGAPSQQSFQSLGSSAGGHQLSQSYGAPVAPANEYLPPVPQYSAPAHQHSAPQYSAPAHHHSAPQYSAPAPQYSAPAQHYSAPAPQYSAPAQHYSAPAQQYSAPAPHYSAPAQHYSAPAPQYSAPVQQFSQPESEYLPPAAPQYSAPAPHYSAPAPQYSAPAQQFGSSDIGSSYESNDDGYHYKTVKRIRYRHRA